ncbi:hypothetical protein BO78DRAFT_323586 [Aspergillus sclerotiicarbonarius CBS 121057]|uniref:Zn(2)-C6 fungal-type domain-containing protein n=1 Tax=Aspergillus sclerotiicarbonarius (strain CBS 121057 / IBT 28362) TaxID=1448318 RepID=A0A319E0X8_ASPSB|nr:hypothetical protein BO78DRAFT_323586 [Aspergillus sclerotiicarbonarius CBS 121057]
MIARRRNGKQASCEPCRKDKVRCDHRSPVCTRCQRRRIPGRCFYHPAPLTRTPAGRENARPSSDVTPSKEGDRRSRASRVDSSGIATVTTSRSASRDGSFRSPRVDRSLPAGYLGPTSFVAALAEDREMMSVSTNPVSEGQDNSELASLPSYWVQKTTEVLDCLQDLPTIQQLVQEYYDVSQAAAIPAPLILNSLDQLSIDIQLPQISAMSVLRNTAQPLAITNDLEGNAFHGLFTGPQLRLEIIGVICAIAGQASCFALAPDRFRGPTGAALRAQFPKRMMEINGLVTTICRMITPTNDLTIWTLHESVVLSSLVHSHSSSVTWHRMGELSTSIFELGLHRDLGDPPIFLQESRRRSFAAAYQLDKNIATFLGRPPRISRRHSDCKLPLDLDEGCLVADRSHLQLALSSLNDNGWSQSAHVYKRSSWIRVRFLISTFREEILELSLNDSSREIANQLRDISRRCQITWESLPDYLHFSTNCWMQGLPVSVCLMLTLAYLTYLYNDFLIERLLVRHDPQNCNRLLDVSARILSTVLTLARHRDNTGDIWRDFISIILLYGFPSASVLIKSLQEHARNGKAIPYTGSRAALIRDLSVFTSHLETIAQSDHVHKELTHRTSQVFLKILDEVLEPEMATTPPHPEFGDLPEISLDGYEIADDMMPFTATDLGVVFDQWIF